MRSPLYTFSFVSLLVGLVLMGAACRSGGGSSSPRSVESPAATSPETVSVGTSCQHEYYPLRRGYSAHYRTTYPPIGRGSDASSGVGGYTVSVTDVQPDVAKLQAVFDGSEGAAPVTSDLEYRCTDGTLYALGYFDLGSRIRGGTAANQFKVTTDRASGEFLPRRIELGSSWSSNFDVTIRPQEVLGDSPLRTPITTHVEIQRAAVVEENVRVAAGEYRALKVHTTTLMDGGVSLTGDEWWVKNVGMVKSVYRSGPTGEIVTEATSITLPR